MILEANNGHVIFAPSAGRERINVTVQDAAYFLLYKGPLTATILHNLRGGFILYFNLTKTVVLSTSQALLR